MATTQRILNVLEARGRVERDSTGYRPGVGLIFGAHAYLNSSPLVLAAQPALHDLAAETGLTATLFKRVGWHRVALARVEGAHPLRYEIPIGERLPLHLGAGKVLCAAMPAEEQQALLAEVAELTRVDGTVRTRSDFEAELIEIRRRGYSYAKGERVPGMVSVAAPVQPAEGPPPPRSRSRAPTRKSPTNGSEPWATRSNEPRTRLPDGSSSRASRCEPEGSVIGSRADLGQRLKVMVGRAPPNRNRGRKCRTGRRCGCR